MELKDFLNRKFTVLIIFLLGVISLPAQKTDSLILELDQVSGSSKVDLLSEICWQLSATDFDKALYYGNQSLILSLEIDYSKGTAQAYNDLGIAYHYHLEFDSAISYYTLSLSIRKNIEDENGIASLHNKIGIIYKYQGQYEKAIEYFLYTLDFYEHSGMALELGMTYNNIAVCYADLEQYDQSLEYYNKAYGIKLQTGNQSEIGGTLINIGNLYYEKGDYQESRRQLLKALEYILKSGSDTYLPSAYNSMGAIEEITGDLDKAQYYYHQSLAILLNGENRIPLISTYTKLGRLSRIRNDAIKSSQYLEKALNLALDEELWPNLIEIYSNLSLLNQQTGNYKTAYEYSLKVQVYKDSMSQKERLEMALELQTRFETAQKEKENELLKADNQIQALKLEQEKQNSRIQLIAMAAVFLLLLFIGLFFYFKNRLNVQQKMANQQKKYFKAVLEAEDRERKRMATDLHDGLGQLLSTAKLNVQGLDQLQLNPDEKLNYVNSISMLDESITELRNISHDIMPGALMKLGLIPAINGIVNKINQSGKIKAEIHGTGTYKRMDDSIEIGIFRVVQEILNNIIHHAGAKEINIRYKQHSGSLEMSIEDNGKGLDPKIFEKSLGLGWKNINSRILLMSGQIKIDGKKDRGTRFDIVIPI